MALLLELLLRQQRCWEKAFKIGYYRHLGTVGLLDLGASGSFAIKGVRLFGQAKGYSMHFGIPGFPCTFLVLPIHHPGALAILLPLEQQRRWRRFSSTPPLLASLSTMRGALKCLYLSRARGHERCSREGKAPH